MMHISIYTHIRTHTHKGPLHSAALLCVMLFKKRITTHGPFQLSQIIYKLWHHVALVALPTHTWTCTPTRHMSDTRVW